MTFSNLAAFVDIVDFDNIDSCADFWIKYSMSPKKKVANAGFLILISSFVFF